ncbi:Uncharacterised protein [Yersinia intermedia]|uniref:hypothetical protein n=1 Tax=Yersinia intermedia TaxID=631 RepID=UPI0005E5842C|nr:hypothetical protein [Yersinia intermedia]CNK46414.1 Uncharacterised protein [Yersinia intermedia]
MHTTKETREFLFTQTCHIISGQLASGNIPVANTYIEQSFEGIYFALQNEYMKTVNKKGPALKDIL